MIKAKFLPPAQRTELEQIVRRPSEDHGVARRANAILLLDDGKSCAVIAEFLYLDDDTVRNWHKQYQSGGLDRLTTFDWKGGLTFLNAAQKTQLCDWLEARLCPDTRPVISWMKKGSGTSVKTTSGRQRVNIHGAVFLESFDAPFVEVTKVNGDSSVALLAKIEAQNPLKSTIHVIWDNAAYHKCERVKNWLSRRGCRINLNRLPAYCPHPNPIERLWGVMHEYVTPNKFYATQPQFATAILAFFRQTIPKNWRNFRDKVTDNFRVISHQGFRVLE